MAKKLLQLPGDKSVRPYLISGVSIQDNGVSISISGDKEPYLVKVPDADTKKRIKMLIERCVEDAGSFAQPDWSFIQAAQVEEIEG